MSVCVCVYGMLTRIYPIMVNYLQNMWVNIWGTIDEALLLAFRACHWKPNFDIFFNRFTFFVRVGGRGGFSTIPLYD